jgi:hypothetical protein
MNRKRTLKDQDFPVKTRDEQIQAADGEEIATADNKDIAENIADRLNRRCLAPS